LINNTEGDIIDASTQLLLTEPHYKQSSKESFNKSTVPTLKD